MIVTLACQLSPETFKIWCAWQSKKYSREDVIDERTLAFHLSNFFDVGDGAGTAQYMHITSPKNHAEDDEGKVIMMIKQRNVKNDTHAWTNEQSMNSLQITKPSVSVLVLHSSVQFFWCLGVWICLFVVNSTNLKRPTTPILYAYTILITRLFIYSGWMIASLKKSNSYNFYDWEGYIKPLFVLLQTQAVTWVWKKSLKWPTFKQKLRT